MQCNEATNKNGYNKSGVHRFKCKVYGARYILEPKRTRDSNETKD